MYFARHVCVVCVVCVPVVCRACVARPDYQYLLTERNLCKALHSSQCTVVSTDSSAAIIYWRIAKQSVQSNRFGHIMSAFLH